MSETGLAAAWRIAFIVLLTAATVWGLRPAARRLERRIAMNIPDADRQKRAMTLLGVGRSVGLSLLLITAALMLVDQLGVDVGPVLAGAGLLGLAISLGAQTLIKDYLSGVIILLENQYRVGDVVQMGAASGTVERIGLRATHLRDFEGRLHIVPNGEVRVVTNQTRDWARALVDLNVAFDADFAKVLKALENAAARASEDEALKGDLLEAPQAAAWIGFSDWAVQVRLMVKTLPGKQWDVSAALRKHALEALAAEGLRPALPRSEISLGNCPPQS